MSLELKNKMSENDFEKIGQMIKNQKNYIFRRDSFFKQLKNQSDVINKIYEDYKEEYLENTNISLERLLNTKSSDLEISLLLFKQIDKRM